MKQNKLIEKVCARLGISQVDLAKKMRCRPETITHWKSDPAKYPMPDKEKEFMLSLLEEPAPKPAPVETNHLRSAQAAAFTASLPVLGKPEDRENQLHGPVQMPALMLGDNGKDCYIWRVSDDSLEPDAFRGDYVIIKPGKPHVPKKPILIKSGGEYQLVKPDKLTREMAHEIVGMVLKYIKEA